MALTKNIHLVEDSYESIIQVLNNRRDQMVIFCADEVALRHFHVDMILSDEPVFQLIGQERRNPVDRSSDRQVIRRWRNGHFLHLGVLGGLPFSDMSHLGDIGNVALIDLNHFPIKTSALFAISAAVDTFDMYINAKANAVFVNVLREGLGVN